MTFALQLNVGVPTLSVNATSIGFGEVALNTPATQSVTLTSSGTAALTVNSATTSGTGFTQSGATFPATLTPGQTATLNVQFDPTVSGAASGQITIVSNSSTGTSVVVTLTGTGVTYSVDLGWDAPSTSSDPVASYNVYRAPSGSSSYTELTSVTESQTAYTDNSVQPGDSYQYYVTSVDASGVESVPSNIAVATIP
jgi:hypothetical protein